MYCQKCGTQLPDDAAFCPTCGTRVGAVSQNYSAGGGTASGRTMDKSTVGKICIGIAVVLLLGALFTYAGDKSDYNNSYGCDGYDYNTDYGLSEHESNVVLVGVLGAILLGVGIFLKSTIEQPKGGAGNADSNWAELGEVYASKQPMGKDSICCSRCGKIQDIDRTTCENCGATFEE